MQSYKAILSIESPLGTPLAASTLWGHICWGIVYHQGQEALQSFISSYRNNKPAMILSDPFPSGWLPMPRLSARRLNEEKASDLSHFEKQKKINKKAWIQSHWFFDSCPISRERLMVENQNEKEDEPHYIQSEITHNMVDRLRGGTIEGMLFRSISWVKDDLNDPDHRELYIWTDSSADQLKEWLNWGLGAGYGAKASVGKGKICVLEISRVKWPNQGNRLLALSAFAPTEEVLLHHLNATTRTHYGKVSGGFVHQEKPFKKPVVMYETGATMSADFGRSYCGALLEGIHDNSDIVHLGLAPLIPFFEEGT